MMQTITDDLVLVLTSPPATQVASERTEGGQPVRRFRKELIRSGKYVKAADKLEFVVTPELLQHWSATFSRMKSAGVRVPVPVGHTEDAEKNRGWCVDMFVEGESLIGAIDLVGEDGIKLAGRSDVSIYCPVTLVDGHGTTYQRPITHVALCTDPVIPGLSGFFPIAASATHKTVILRLERTATMPDSAPAASAAVPPVEPSKPSEAVKASFKQAVMAVLDDTKLDEATMIAKVKDIIKAMGKAVGLLDGKADDAVTDAAGDASVAASRKPDPMLLQLAGKSRKQDLDSLAKDGKISPACRDKLAAAWLGDALALTLTAVGIQQFDAIVAALSENQPVGLGERTGAQTLTLSRADAEKAATEQAKAVHDEMAGMCGLQK